jgi:hypothetical protein
MLRQKNDDFQANLGYRARPWLKNNNKKETKTKKCCQPDTKKKLIDKYKRVYTRENNFT